MTDTTTADSSSTPAPASPARGVGRTAWWLSTRRRRPEWQSLAGAGLATFSGRPRANFEQAQTGDPVLLYVARPDRAIRAVGIITHVGGSPAEPPHPALDGTGEDGATPAAPGREALHVEVQFAFEVPNPLPWQEIHAVPGLAEAEPVKQRSSGTLFYLSPVEYALLEQHIIARNPELAAAFRAINSGAPLPGTVEPQAAADAPLRAQAR
ncbi:MAG TPA: hypothetical protein VM536_18220, partial [Chloroflexia bacterium]|nr:hypothetical protein [Chloroflexia bacterium]